MSCVDDCERWWPPSERALCGAGKALFAVAFATGVVYVHRVPIMRSIYKTLTEMHVPAPAAVVTTKLTFCDSEDRDYARDVLIPALKAHCKAHEPQTLEFRLRNPHPSSTGPAPESKLQLTIYARFRSWQALTNVHQQSGPYMNLRTEIQRLRGLGHVHKHVEIDIETNVGFCA